MKLSQKLIDSFTNQQRAAYFAAGKVKAESILYNVAEKPQEQVELKTYWIVTIHDTVMRIGPNWRNNTEEEALAYGKRLHEDFTAIAKAAGLL